MRNPGLAAPLIWETHRRDSLSPVLGRLTRPSDDGAGVPPVAVLAHDYWIRRFGGDSSIVGKPVTLGKTSVTVIGVLQPAPFFPDRVDMLANMVNSERRQPDAHARGPPRA
ncbi:MAG: ABC transporter permease [Longimicrobiales bacterium]